MSDQITTAFVQQFSANVMALAQQGRSRFRGTTMEETIEGEKAFFEQIGATEMQEVTTRHADTPLVDTPHERRMLTTSSFDWADLIDRRDRIRTLIDPTNPYAQNAARAAARKIDDIIIDGLTGTAKSGKDGSTSNTLGSANTVAVDFKEDGSSSDSNLTPGKIRRAKQIMDEFELDDEDRVFAASSSALMSLLRNTEVTSDDFNAVKPLVRGEIDTWMGFRFIRSQRLGIDSNNVRDCIAYQRSGLMFGVGQDVTVDIGPRRDKRNSTQVYLSMDFGAVRMEEEKVVLVKADEDL